MLSFTSSLSPDCEAFAIFVTEKYDYKNKKNILPNNEVKKINSFLDALKVKKKDEELSSFDVSNRQKCFIIKVKNKYKDYYPQEIGGTLFSFVKKFKDIKKVEFYVDSLDFDKEKKAKFFSEFIFGFNLKGYGRTRIYGFLAERYLSYWFNKYTKPLLWPVIFYDITK